jgi:ribonucleotide monophosphatase NagD (HAD superfamily)
MLETIVGRIGLDVADCVMTGDRLYTEIRMALDADMVSALIMTGKTTAEKLAVGPEEDKLACVLDRIDRLIPGRLWEEVDWSEDEA